MKAEQTESQRDALAYALAKQFLLGLGAKGATTELLAKYLSVLRLNGPPPSTLPEIYEQLLYSAQTGNMKAGVIGRAVDGDVHALGKVLNGFDPTKVVREYGDDWRAVLDAVVRDVRPRGQIRRTSRSIWPRYCRCILSAARFMAQFQDAADFYAWAEPFRRDERSRLGLPLILAGEIDGLGFTLACDFLKELGFEEFPKPDVHLRVIFESLGLCPKDVDVIGLCKAIMRVAHHAGVSAYTADKVFWLVGSGHFYLDEESVGRRGRIGSHRAEFIEWAKRESSKRIENLEA